MESSTALQSEQAGMQLPPSANGQDIVADYDRDRWLEQAAFALYRARQAEFPEAFPLTWDLAPKSVRGDFRYIVKSAYRRSLPMVSDCLTEIVATTYANQEGWSYPACDNKPTPEVYDRDLPAAIAQRRQTFRLKARTLLSAIWRYLEHDSDTVEQRQQTVTRVNGQLKADQMVVSTFRTNRGLPAEAQHG